MHFVRVCAILALALAGCGSDDEAARATAPGPAAAAGTASHERCAWIGQDTYEDGVATFTANADYFTAIHPKWYELAADGSIRVFANAGDARIADTARARGILLMPMIANSTKESLRAMLGSDAARADHVARLVALVVDNGWDGLDIDYEHLWSAADRPGYEAFIAALAGELHAAGKQLSVAVPGLVEPLAQSAYDYGFLAAHADAVHIMGYDFHSVGTHSGPVAPLGWVEAVTAYAASVDASRFILAVPNYGVTPTWYGAFKQAAGACAAGARMSTDHMASCPYGHYDSGRAPNCTLANGETLYYDDLDSLAEKIAAARGNGLRGVSYWTVGGEPPGFFDRVREYY
jgi:spore germination protein YaaH